MSLLTTIAVEAQTTPSTRAGPFAFHYARVLSEERLQWYSRFEILVTHDPLPREQIDRLHAAGTKLLFYEWTVAFYQSRATNWQRSLLANQKEGLLHAEPLTGFAGSETAPAWYYDPGASDYARARSADLVSRLQESGYDGVFFDTTRFQSVHPVARIEFDHRHPTKSYDLYIARFLIELRRQRPNAILFTNQGYRSPEYYLPYVDWDLSESLITGPHGESYRLRPWYDMTRRWSTIHYVMKAMIEPMVKRYPHVRFGHLNYSDGRRETIAVAVATAQMFGGEAYIASPDLAEEKHPIYFRSPGREISPRVDHEDGAGSHQFFEHGLIAVVADERSIVIDLSGMPPLRERSTGRIVCNERLTLTGGEEPRAFFYDVVPECDD